MRKLFPFIAIMLVYAFTPGMCELAETSVHFASTGDLHGSDEERHAEHGDAQGEGDGECHTCFCHAPTSFLVAWQAVAPSVAVAHDHREVFASDDVASDGAMRELDRPPIG